MDNNDNNRSLNVNDYCAAAMRTNLSPEQYAEASERLVKLVEVNHALFGLSTEVGELVDDFKRHVYYGQSLDAFNVRIEAGDIMWYLALLMAWVQKETGSDPSAVLLANIAKLTVRFPEKFSNASASDRDLTAEEQAVQHVLDLQVEGGLN